MSVPSLSVLVTRDGGTLTLLVAGEVDMATAPRLAAALDGALEQTDPGPHRVVVDLADVGFLDSAGLHVLVDLAARLDPAGCELTVVCPVGAPPRRVIELTGLAERLGLAAAHPVERRDDTSDVPAPRRG